MKKLFPLLLLTLLPYFSFAQDTYPKFNPGFRFNPSLGGVAAETTTELYNSVNNGSMKFGFSVGVMGDYMIKQNYGISVELRLTQFDAQYEVIPNYVPGYSSKLTQDIFFQFVELPISLKMKTNEFGYSKFYIQVGIVPSVLTRARVDTKFESNNPSTPSYSTQNKSIYSNSTPIDFGVFAGAGIEYTISGSTALLGGISYHNGFVDLSKDENFSIKARYVSLDLGIIF